MFSSPALLPLSPILELSPVSSLSDNDLRASTSTIEIYTLDSDKNLEGIANTAEKIKLTLCPSPTFHNQNEKTVSIAQIHPSVSHTTTRGSLLPPTQHQNLKTKAGRHCENFPRPISSKRMSSQINQTNDPDYPPSSKEIATEIWKKKRIHQLQRNKPFKTSRAALAHQRYSHRKESINNSLFQNVY